jgi:hypothetical protein
MPLYSRDFFQPKRVTPHENEHKNLPEENYSRRFALSRKYIFIHWIKLHGTMVRECHFASSQVAWWMAQVANTIVIASPNFLNLEKECSWKQGRFLFAYRTTLGLSHSYEAESISAYDLWGRDKRRTTGLERRHSGHPLRAGCPLTNWIDTPRGGLALPLVMCPFDWVDTDPNEKARLIVRSFRTQKLTTFHDQHST